MSGPAQVFTTAGARSLDRAAVVEANARAAQETALAKEAAMLADLRIRQAQDEAAERSRQRRDARRAQVAAAQQAQQVERAARRAQRRAGVVAAWRDRRALVAVVPMMATSAAVALPAQYDYYRQHTGSSWSAAMISAMVEGGTWLGAALESAAIERDSPAGSYRVLTWTLAATAAAVNVGHGMSMPGGGWQVAVVFALASLMGVTSWSAYSHLRAHRDTGRTAAEKRTALWRRLRYPRRSWQAASVRLAAVPPISAEQAWVQVWTTRPHRVEVTALDPPMNTAGDEVDPDQSGRVEVDPGGAVEVDPFDSLPDDLWDQHPDSGTTEPVSPVGAVEAVAPGRVEAGRVLPVWLEPVPAGAAEDGADADPGTDALMAQLTGAIEAGELPVDPSAEAVRMRLGIRWQRAKTLLDQRAALARDEARDDVADETRPWVEVDPDEARPVLVGAR